MLERLTEDALLLVVSFLGVPDMLRMSRTCRHLRQTLGNPDSSIITNIFQKQWGSHFAVWQPLFAVARTSTRFQTAAVCDKLAAMCGCWTLLNIEGYSSTVRGGVCSVLPTADGLRVCLVAPKRVCLDDFEWTDSHPLQDIDRAVAFLGRLSVIEAIECTYLADRVLPAFTLDIRLFETFLMLPSPKHPSGLTTMEARLVGRKFTPNGDVDTCTMQSIRCSQLINELRASFDPCLPHHDVFYTSQAPAGARGTEAEEEEDKGQKCDGQPHGLSGHGSHHSAQSLGSDRMKDTSRHSLSRADFNVLLGQNASGPPTPPSSARSPMPHSRCSICSQSLPSSGVQCCSSECTCARTDRPLRLNVRFITGTTCCLGFVCCPATLPRFHSADLLPLFNLAYPLASPWSSTPPPSPETNPSRLALMPPPSCLCGVQGLWAGHYGPHGIEIICILQVDLQFVIVLDAILKNYIFFSHAHAQARDRKFAVKVTGDPNVPAGQVTFVVPCQPLLLRPSALPCGCRSELRRGIFGAQDAEEECNCIPLPRANSISGVPVRDCVRSHIR